MSANTSKNLLFAQKQPKDEEIKPVREVEIKQSDKEDDSACVIS